MDFLPDKIPWGIIIGLGVLAVVWVVVSEEVDRRRCGNQVGFQASVLPPQPTVTPFVPTISSSGLGQKFYFGNRVIMYHGTRLEWARDILSKDRWKLGLDGKIFMTPDFQLAVRHAIKGGLSGTVIELYVGPNVYLDKFADKEFCAQIVGGEAGKYYRLKGIRANKLLDPNDRQKQVC